MRAEDQDCQLKKLWDIYKVGLLLKGQKEKKKKRERSQELDSHWLNIDNQNKVFLSIRPRPSPLI